jgi:hypothetical protein
MDVILGIDETTGNSFVLFGRSTIRAVCACGRSFDCTVLRVHILLETDELEALTAAVSAAKAITNTRRPRRSHGIDRLLGMPTHCSLACSF